MQILNILLKIFALNCKTMCSSSSIELSWSLTRIVFNASILGVTNAYSFYYKACNLYADIGFSIKYPDMIQMIFDYIQYIVDLTFVYVHGRKLNPEYLKHFDNIDAMFGIKDYSSINKTLGRTTAMILIIWLVTCVVDFVSWAFSYGWITSVVFANSYVFLFIKILNTLDLCYHVLNIEYRLRVMCDFLQDFYVSSDNNLASLNFAEDPVINKNWLHHDQCSWSVNTNRRLQYLKSTLPDHHQSQWLSKCYLMLVEQSDFVNCRFGIRMLLCGLSILIDMVRFTNLALRILNGSQYTVEGMRHSTASSSLMKMFLCATLLVMLAYRCEGCYSQLQRILVITDHMIVNKKLGQGFKECLNEFRGLLLTRPISFHMADFLRIDFPLLASIASVVVTYTIILLQSVKN